MVTHMGHKSVATLEVACIKFTPRWHFANEQVPVLFSDHYYYTRFGFTSNPYIFSVYHDFV